MAAVDDTIPTDPPSNSNALLRISEDNDTVPYATTQDFNSVLSDDEKSPPNAHNRRPSQLQALRARYSSRRMILPEKDRSTVPRCFDCGAFYHVQSDPVTAYDGVGIFCELCGKNREDNPELLLDAHYYKCEGCENIDICSQCYLAEKQKLADADLKENNDDEDDAKTSVVWEEKETDKESAPTKNSALRVWMEEHNIWQRELFDGLQATTECAADMEQPLTMVSKMSTELFDGVVRKVRLEVFSKVKQSAARKECDALLLRFEKVWMKAAGIKPVKKK